MQQSSWLRGKITFFIIFVIAIGIFLRFSNLDHKIYWGDEVYSSLRIFGYTTEQMHREVTIGQPVNAATLQQFQNPSTQNGIAQTVQVLVKEDSHLTPLYFVIGRIWTGWFGSSATAVRSLSVTFSLLMLPVFYWLAMELFGSVTIAWTSVLLTSISPIQMVFAQEARFYSLWLLTTVLSSAALLRAMRIQTWTSWGQFTIALIANLYTQFLAVFTFAGYVSYVLITTMLQPAGKRDWKAFTYFAGSATIGGLSFVPWLWIFLQHQADDDADTSTLQTRSLIKAVKNLFVVFSRAFIDFNWDSNASKLQLGILGIVTVTCFGIVFAAIRYVIQNTKRRSWLFVMILLVSTLLPLLPLSLKDALPTRYLLPSYLALQLAIAYLLGSNLQNSLACRPRWLWSTATIFLVSIGLLSCGSIARADSWWIKQYSSCNIEVAQIVNRSLKPLVVSDGSGVRTFDHALSNVISLARMVKPETQFQVFLENNLPDSIKIADGFNDRFLLTPSKKLLAKLESQYPGQLQPEVSGSHQRYRNGKDYCLWRLPLN